ncbi:MULTISPECIES: LysR family transcriptional regulator [Variovorax]|jgi:DNA-binding transcriptional LysR family regulator|uniref:LysR family transcriptional regulator n=1 Tax=Variovorax TaxID=34072 RepID=UPI00086A81B0|nr:MULTISPECIES: LysR family transcriptional regulator [Variovorax]MBN8758514.1 LysR family transcriptional regulator [Variovorax sp.]ODU18791.1 MAG: LysR family transcriptional regulator [Variovorax sp. SCN 67-85]ODV17966.1 MAG: LysR family transcriptional regulator [Variovorax sp. SCN 67-20]OJZ05675.1 MAG: LysR family transcriptional regulator [Variovorax sp. 67-131]UKI07607.1 LysR family transcriptional regulator [Variovorax paradoxus]
MTLVQLRHLISLAETASFTRSAETLFLTQPALSRSINALEEELGQKLFDRVGRRSELTHFGHEVLQRARRLVFDADELAASGGRKLGGRTSTLRVGLGSGPGALLTRPLLAGMAQRGATVRVDILRGEENRLVQALRDRQIDAVVLEIHSFRPATDLRVEAVTEMRGAFMCRTGHPLTRKRGAIRFETVREFPIASTKLGNDVVREMVETYGPQGHPDECVSLRCNELSSLVEVVRESDAVLFAIRAAAPDLVELPVRPAIETRAHFGLITRAGHTDAPAMSMLRTLISKILRD